MLALYTNIKKRREELGMSQEELAKKTGYSSRSMIAKIEAGKIDLYQSKVKEIADALEISIGSLMGWDADTNQGQPEPRKQCSANRNIEFYDKKMLDVFTQLNDDNKKKSIIYTENLLSNQKLDEELFINAAHERTDVEVTDEMRKHDDDIMNNPDEWK